MPPRASLRFAALAASLLLAGLVFAAPPPYRIEQITHGPENYFFGYDGHQQTIPWSGDGHSIVALRSPFQDRMPRDHRDAATIVLIDTRTGVITPVEASHAWNIQQGTMLYWNPQHPTEEFFFNDRRADEKVFTVLYNIRTHQRREFTFADKSIGNGNVDPAGGRFAAFDYGRVYRTVVSYPRAYNFTAGQGHPANDGLFVVDVASGRARLIVTYEQLYQQLKDQFPELSRPPVGIYNQLFINHTHWNRDGDRLWFVVRWFREDSDTTYYTEGFAVNPDGTHLEHSPENISHPDWERGHRMLSGGTVVPGGRLDANGKPRREHVIYDTDLHRVVEVIAPDFFVEPGEPALSPDLRWIASTENGKEAGRKARRIVVYDRETHTGFKLPLYPNEVPHTPKIDNPFRIDMPPRWNRDGTQILFETLATDGTRQLYIAHLNIPPARR